MSLLYQSWNKIASARRNDFALRDLASGQSWTFAQLLADGEAQPADSDLICPQGNSPAFILSLLAAWRAGKTVCPLESGQTAPKCPAPPKGCVHLKWTSGTTDAPRLVAFTPEQLAADADAIVPAMGLRPDWPNLGVISLAHSYGFSNLALPLLLHGIPLILAPGPLPEIVRNAAACASAVTLAAVPALWRIWHEAGGIPSQVKLAISAGAPLPLALEQSVFAATGVKIHNFYGASECGGIAYDATPEPRTDASLVGAAMPGVNVSLNSNSCLIVRSPGVGQTYFPHPCPTLANGQFQTSDLAEIENGQIFLRGRASDQINVAGRKVSPETIERALLAHPAVRECLVFGAPCADSGRTEVIVALVVGAIGESELKKFLLDNLPSWQVPRRWQFVESLPSTPRGKLPRAACRAQFMESN